jgi:hypothetical protein
MKEKNTITKFESATKQHVKLKGSALTACNRKSSGVNTHDYNDKSWEWTIKNYPNMCCAKCLAKFNNQ